MADQQSRGGKKKGKQQPGQSEQHQESKPPEDRPARGEAGGPKPNADQTRPQTDEKK